MGHAESTDDAPDEAVSGVGVTPTPPAVAESTVGTGSVIALGCTLLTLLIICVGIAIFIWRQAG